MVIEAMLMDQVERGDDRDDRAEPEDPGEREDDLGDKEDDPGETEDDLGDREDDPGDRAEPEDLGERAEDRKKDAAEGRPGRVVERTCWPTLLHFSVVLFLPGFWTFWYAFLPLKVLYFRCCVVFVSPFWLGVRVRGLHSR